MLSCGNNQTLRVREEDAGRVILDSLHQQQRMQRFCDVTLLVCGKTYFAHRNILATRSSFFDERFNAETPGMESFTVSCSDQLVFELFLEYMYTGVINVNLNNIVTIHHLANYFHVKTLVSHCENFLVKITSLNNCFSIQDIAEKCKMNDIYQNCSLFISNHKSEVLKGDEILRRSLYQMERIISTNELELSPRQQLVLISDWAMYDCCIREDQIGQLLRHVNLKSIPEATSVVAGIQLSDKCLYEVLSKMRSSGVELESLGEQFEELLGTFSDKMPACDILGMAVSATIGCAESATDALCVTTPTNENREIECFSSIDPIKHSTVQESKSRSTRASLDMSSSKHKERIDHTDNEENPPLLLTLRTNRRKGNPMKVVRLKKIKMQKKIHSRPTKTKKKSGKSRKKGVEIVETSAVLNDMDVTNEDNDSDSPVIDHDLVNTEPTQAKKRTRNTSTLKVKCTECLFTASTQEALFDHMGSVHNSSVSHHCDVCSYETTSTKDYYKHMKIHLDGPPYLCDFDGCTYKNSHLPHMLNHRMKHTGKRPYGCPSCPRKLKTRANLVAHLRCHTGEKPFKCDTCDRCFATKNTMEQHRVTHSDTRPYLCDLCGFSTKYQNHLISHKRVHSGNVFRCQFPECTYFTPKRSQLSAHMRTHMAVRSHMCSTCGRGFVEKSHLVRHERIHLQEKPFRCSQCDYGSSRRDKLKEHITRHHGENASVKSSYKQRRQRTRKDNLVSQESDLIFVTNTSIKDRNQVSEYPVLGRQGKPKVPCTQPILNFDKGVQDAVMTSPPVGLMPQNSNLYLLQRVAPPVVNEPYHLHNDKTHQDGNAPNITTLVNMVVPLSHSQTGGTTVQSQQGTVPGNVRTPMVSSQNTTNSNTTCPPYTFDYNRPGIYMVQPQYHTQ